MLITIGQCQHTCLRWSDLSSSFTSSLGNAVLRSVSRPADCHVSELVAQGVIVARLKRTHSECNIRPKLMSADAL